MRRHRYRRWRALPPVQFADATPRGARHERRAAVGRDLGGRGGGTARADAPAAGRARLRYRRARARPGLRRGLERSAARDAGPGFTAANLAERGRITGYTLDYVLPNAIVPQKRPMLLAVQTIVERYRDRAAAAHGLSFWRGVTRRRSGVYSGAVTVGLSVFRARVANGSFAFELSYRRVGTGALPRRRHRLPVRTAAGCSVRERHRLNGLRARTLDLADHLAIRIRRVLAGQIHSSPLIPGAEGEVGVACVDGLAGAGWCPLGVLSVASSVPTSSPRRGTRSSQTPSPGAVGHC